ncbi:fructose-1-6-bisphosphatase [Xylariaceae sp. FL0255]|nr:fructose-1-6-bisphosphatase [Xylariaceae sp. FL0255]
MGDIKMEGPNTKDLAAHLRSAFGQGYHQSLIDSVIPALLDSIAATAETLRTAHHVGRVGSANAFGDDQLNVDVLAEQHIRSALDRCPSVVTASSEEDPVERAVHNVPVSKYEEVYTVAFDPLDGSSIIAPNWTVGTIIGIWGGRTALAVRPSWRLTVSIIGVYGPRTTAYLAAKNMEGDDLCLELGINGPGQPIEIIRPKVRFAEPPYKTRYFAPANLRAANEDPAYMGLVTNLIANRYTLRYSGGLVPDIVHALVKGHGLYISPVSPGSKAKLRRLYELLPIALLIECAGGVAMDPVEQCRILGYELRDINETGPLICGNRGEVYTKMSLYQELRRSTNTTYV